MSGEEREHAFMLMQFLNNRGGMVKLECIEKPPEITVPKNKAVCAALDAAIALEEQNTKSLRELAALAEKCKDELTVDFIVTQYLYEQVFSLNSDGKSLSIFYIRCIHAYFRWNLFNCCKVLKPN